MRRWLAFIRSSLFSLMPRTHYLRRLIWFGCLTVSIPLVIAGSAYYQYSVIKLTAQFKEDAKGSLTVVKDHMENVLGNIEQESLKIAINPLAKENIGKEGFGTEWFLHMSIQELLQVHKNSNHFIDDIVFYEGLSGVVLSNNYGYVLLDRYKDKADIHTALSLSSPAAWSYLPEGRKQGYISYIRRMPDVPADHPQGVLIIQVKEELLQKHIMTYATYSRSQSLFVLDSQDRIFIHSTDEGAAGPSTEDKIGLDLIRKHEDSSGQYALKSDNGQSYIGVFHKTMLGRTYISLLPENELLQQVGWIRWLTVSSVLVFLLLGMLLTFFSSRLVYNPIENLIKYGEKLQRGRGIDPRGNEIEFIQSCLGYLNEQAQALERYIQKTQPSLRNQLLKKLLKSSAVNRGSLADECAEFQIPTNGSFLVLVTRVENLFNEKRFMPNENAIVLFAITNVIQELLAKSPMDGYVLEDNERESITILHFSEGLSREQMADMTRTLAEDIQSALRQYLSFSVSSGIGGICTKITHLSESYREAREALQYRIFNDTQAILFFDEMDASPAQSQFFYPREHERVIIAALSRGELGYAEKGLEQFAQSVRASESYHTIYQCYHVLLSSIIQSLEEEGPGVIDALEGNWFDQLKARQTAREIYDWFIETIFPLYQKMTEDFRKQSVKIAIQKVCKHIRENPGSNYSLIECADMIGMSPSYLSRMFKKEVGVPFIEYMMEFKVETAKQSLQDTDLSVTEIAGMVGYSERNLNRTFQRYVGMSPKQYRMSHR
ncbi:helix-turn-helix domain-containing protein [Paenibacillus puerhi]|uniref:helix-turn-helix domain-containing protein n=1 Tax=Paenibacillus puerhi TaxID=2692622 RepID=UPI001357C815|nr:helix-turn-helix domain-containing protein [Paenibacillus puerhi]